ncbi:MAG: phosphoglycerate dehydrogenase [bacterium]
MKILVSDPLQEEGLKILRETGAEVSLKTGMREDELISIIPDFDCLVIRSETKVTAKVIESAKKLKIIGRAGVGVDNIDVKAATRKGIIVMNTPDSNTISTAEHTMAMILASSRKIPQAYTSLKSQKWERKLFVGYELFSKTLGIIGLGRIGKQVAIRASSFGMNIIGYDPFLSQDLAKDFKITLVSLEKLFKQSDYITIHTPLSEKTRHLISKREIEMMKDGVIIINCARGGIIDEAALCDGLKSGKIRSAALDVFEKEPPLDSPLLSLDNCVFVPHLGASTIEAQKSVGIEIAAQIKDALEGKVRNAINLPQISPDVTKRLGPWIFLCEAQAKFSSQTIEGSLKEISVEYIGEIEDSEILPLTNTIVVFILSSLLPEENVNYVNAQSIAEEMGIGISFLKSKEKTDYSALISLSLTTDKEKITTQATLFREKFGKIVLIDDFSVEVSLEGNILVLSQTDQPGIIGKIGTILSEQGINIGNLQLARKEKGGPALSVWNLDGELSGDIISKIKEMPQILKVRVASL